MSILIESSNSQLGFRVKSKLYPHVVWSIYKLLIYGLKIDTLPTWAVYFCYPLALEKKEKKYQNKTLLSPHRKSHAQPPITTATNGGDYRFGPKLMYPLSLTAWSLEFLSLIPNPIKEKIGFRERKSRKVGYG